MNWAVCGLHPPGNPIKKNKVLSPGEASCPKKAFAIFNLASHILRVVKTYQNRFSAAFSYLESVSFREITTVDKSHFKASPYADTICYRLLPTVLFSGFFEHAYC